MRTRTLLGTFAVSLALLGCPPPAPVPEDGGTDPADSGVSASPLPKPPGALERPPSRLPDDLRPPK